jgi:hypothetical protein
MFDSYYRFTIIERTLESAVDGGVTVTTGNCFGPPLVRPRLKRRTEHTVRSIRDTSSMNCNYRLPSQVICKGSNPVTLARLFPSLNPIRTEGSISDWISADKTTVQ